MIQEHRVGTYLYMSHHMEDIIGPVGGELADTRSSRGARRTCSEVKA